jgi:hypothetical protein
MDLLVKGLHASGPEGLAPVIYSVPFHSIPFFLFFSVLLYRRSKGSKRTNHYCCAVRRFAVFFVVWPRSTSHWEVALS